MKRIGLPLLFLILLLPFIHRPWLFDDPSFLIAARAAADHPLAPHTYNLDLGDAKDSPVWEKGRAPATTNPPLSAWAMGAVLRVFGDREAPLHLFMFLLAALALPAVSALAQFFIGRKSFTALLFAVSPVYFLTSLTLYPHFVYFFFYAWTLYACWRLRETQQWVWAVAVGVLLALSALSLYQWPVLAVLVCIFLLYGQPGRREVQQLAAACGVFLVLFGAWQIWEIHMYGTPHMWASYRARASAAYQWRIALLPLIFMGGSIPALAASWRLLIRRQQRSAILAAAASLVFFLFLGGPQGGFSWGQSALLTLFFSSAVVFLICLALFFPQAEPEDRLLLIWFLIEFAFAMKYLGYSAGHMLLPLALPTVILFGRLWTSWKMPDRGFLGLTSGVFCLSVLLAYADLSTAEIGPKMAAEAPRLAQSHALYYWGNSFSGLSYYLHQAGGKSFKPDQPIKPGDVVLLPRNLNTQGPPTALFKSGLKIVETVPFLVKNPLRTFSIADGAGWYSASWGPLPYTWSWGPLEQVLVLRKEETP